MLSHRKTIFVVDDEPDIVELVTYNLEREGFKAVGFTESSTVLEKAKQLQPDLIILDVMMPDIDGFELCKKLRSTPETAKIPVMFLTARTGEVDHIIGLELGGDDYVVKPISPRVLIARVKSLLRRFSEQARVERIVAPEVLRIGTLEIHRQNYTVWIDGVEMFFPKKEFELLAFLAANPDKVFTRYQLLNRIWGETVYVVERTVDVHISKIRDKLGRYASCIETVKGVGYRFRWKSEPVETST
ncbi:MAG: response regulator transcription factor [Bacteroidota bacterium]|nr:response regulator transcription factor [Candidatus Kapabacteria bacterium]MCS7303134.1 response regulator transcription factor [Candidatus Kapabacteria bacterium]MCX7937215.1 response regulator transcription factor [Chlorobiota bacterium]MDW8075700.1 response regulator transcription factor [Bacteroidota bacterium]MDW8272078.1 response regulator transcription factor [Bacteroidota bacterium]